MARPVIVTARPHGRKRKAKAALPVEIAVPRVIQAIPKGRARRVKELEPDSEADARVAAFFAKMGLKLPDESGRVNGGSITVAGRTAC